ncbi:hypothetical protein KPZU09_30420 [Klebsiella pneumoniae]|uniref:Molybdopterin dinucleotide-binding domain-containing protein n=1 Tax=Klebsiella pneumoniae TaxID=573 RepID=A0A919LNE8_KLEPN|nr:hypothetical protein KPZU09_30420 [Klebsiella pneumoniae]
MHPSDAQARDIREGSVVKVYNDRGAILAGVHLSEQILPGVVQMSTGAWYDPLDPKEERSLDKHGNPNVLTEDRGSSRLGQGCSAQSCWVEIARGERSCRRSLPLIRRSLLKFRRCRSPAAGRVARRRRGMRRLRQSPPLTV